MQNLSYENARVCFAYKWTWRRNSFSYELLRLKTRFETEANGEGYSTQYSHLKSSTFLEIVTNEKGLNREILIIYSIVEQPHSQEKPRARGWLLTIMHCVPVKWSKSGVYLLTRSSSLRLCQESIKSIAVVSKNKGTSRKWLLVVVFSLWNNIGRNFLNFCSRNLTFLRFPSRCRIHSHTSLFSTVLERPWWWGCQHKVGYRYNGW